MRRWQVEMAALLRKQRERGGVIDPNTSNDVIDETWVWQVVCLFMITVFIKAIVPW